MGLIGTVFAYFVFCFVNTWCADLVVKVTESTSKKVLLTCAVDL